jgi:hypothetical protein
MTQHNYCGHDLRWDGNRLRLHSGRVLAVVEPDARWSGMWRVRLPNGSLTDLVNMSRARDAAVSLALETLKCRYQEAA